MGEKKKKACQRRKTKKETSEKMEERTKEVRGGW